MKRALTAIKSGWLLPISRRFTVSLCRILFKGVENPDLSIGEIMKLV